MNFKDFGKLQAMRAGRSKLFEVLLGNLLQN